MRDMFGSHAREEEGEWLSIADLMAGLMVIFLFVAVVFIRSHEARQKELEEAPLDFTADEAFFAMPTLADWALAIPDEAAPAPVEAEMVVAPVIEVAEAPIEPEPVIEVAEAPAIVLPEVILPPEMPEIVEAAEDGTLIRVSEDVAQVVEDWLRNEGEIYDALLAEFEDDLPRWNAEIGRETLQVRFRAPEVLFQTGRAELRPRFAEILEDFFPRYVEILSQFADTIEEVRIEGHTSSAWNYGTSEEEAYFLNMELSQERTRAVLQHALTLDAIADSRDWLQPLLTANGLSSSRPILAAPGREDLERSRRVEFRVRTTAREELGRLIDMTP